LPEIGKLFTKLERVKQEPVEDGKFEVVD
jgi:hypothetical protein